MMPPQINLDPSQLSAAARLFSSAVFNEMSQTGKSPLFSRLIYQSQAYELVGPTSIVGDLFDVVFNVLKDKAYRHEYSYKAAIINKILLGTHSLHTASMLSEFRVGKSKADIVILNGTSSAYEIKSERDNLNRLEGQLESYLKVFAKVNIITGEGHLEKINSIANKDVGLLLLNDRYQISIIRKPIERKDRIEPRMLFESLQRKEQIEILMQFGVSPPAVPNTQLHEALLEKFLKLPSAQLHDITIKTLKKTRSLIRLQDFTRSIPPSLRAIALSISLNKSEQERFVLAIKTKTSEALSWGQ
jgi:hypothetical protein